MKKILVFSTLFIFLAGCAYDEQGNLKKSSWGAVLGGLGGAAVGSAFGSGSGKSAAIATGAILGSLAGSQIGKHLDEEDQKKLQETQQFALENNRVNQKSTWDNPDTHHYGSITPIKTFDGRNHGYEVCREYTQEINVGGKKEQGYGTACRTADGAWKIIEG
jgi:surface antigen